MEISGPRLVGDWEVGAHVGSGSFAIVWRGRHRLTGQDAAIKEINLSRLNAKLRSSLESEVTILRRIKHANIVRLLDVIETRSRLYLVMEFCAGGDLSQFLRHGRVLPEATARHFLRQLAAGLREMWAHHLVHRDLKPQNLLLSRSSPEADLRIADFGFARNLQPQGLAETLCGSPLYMAPEILGSHKYDAKADLWSVGAILFEMVGGRPPFTGANQLQLLRSIQRAPARLPEGAAAALSAPCRALIAALLRPNPVERISFEEFFRHPFLRADFASTPPYVLHSGIAGRGPQPMPRSRSAAGFGQQVVGFDGPGLTAPGTNAAAVHAAVPLGALSHALRSRASLDAAREGAVVAARGAPAPRDAAPPGGAVPPSPPVLPGWAAAGSAPVRTGLGHVPLVPGPGRRTESPAPQEVRRSVARHPLAPEPTSDVQSGASSQTSEEGFVLVSALPSPERARRGARSGEGDVALGLEPVSVRPREAEPGDPSLVPQRAEARPPPSDEDGRETPSGPDSDNDASSDSLSGHAFAGRASPGAGPPGDDPGWTTWRGPGPARRLWRQVAGLLCALARDAEGGRSAAGAAAFDPGAALSLHLAALQLLDAAAGGGQVEDEAELGGDGPSHPPRPRSPRSPDSHLDGLPCTSLGTEIRAALEGAGRAAAALEGAGRAAAALEGAGRAAAAPEGAAAAPRDPSSHGASALSPDGMPETGPSPALPDPWAALFAGALAWAREGAVRELVGGGGGGGGELYARALHSLSFLALADVEGGEGAPHAPRLADLQPPVALERGDRARVLRYRSAVLARLIACGGGAGSGETPSSKSTAPWAEAAPARDPLAGARP
ncbi:ATG1 [Auxenochlorella protothecoides x Auxenochlorella symbiontica]